MGAPTLSLPPRLQERTTEKLIFAAFCSQAGLVRSLMELCALGFFKEQIEDWQTVLLPVIFCIHM